MAPYLVAQHSREDRWSLVEATGWFEYMRVAPFADCSRFTPPSGTEFLCETTPPSQRPGPDWYIWGGGPARATYGDFRVGNDQLRAFSMAAIKAQPIDYSKEVLTDLGRYLLPLEPRHKVAPGTGPDVLRVHRYASSPLAVDNVTAQLTSYYGMPSVKTQGFLLDRLGRMQQVLRVGTLALSSAMLLALIGAIRLRRERGWILLFVGLTLATLLACVATSNFSTRYAVPVIPFAFIAAALAGSGLTRSPKRDRGVVEHPIEATSGRTQQLVPVP
jgi:hypothetical protein